MTAVTWFILSLVCHFIKNRLTTEQRLFGSSEASRDASNYWLANRSAKSVIIATMDRFRTTFTLVDNAHPQRCRTVLTKEEDFAAVEQIIEKEPNESVRHRGQQLELCLSTLWKILRKDLSLRAYKIELVQDFKSNED